MKKKHKIIAIVLCICLVAGLFSQWAFAADKEINVGSDDSFDDIIELDHNTESNWNAIKSRIENAPTGSRVKIIVTGAVRLPSILKNSNGASFYIVGRGNNAIIRPSLDVPSETFSGKYLFKVENGNRTAQLSIMNVTL